eukprot:scaffold64406_cov53-Attheya_sp.AAC.1
MSSPRSTKIQNPRLNTRGHFIPSGIYLIETPKLYTVLLKEHKQYLLNNLAVVLTVFGIPFDTLASKIKMEGYKGSRWQKGANSLFSVLRPA